MLYFSLLHLYGTNDRYITDHAEYSIYDLAACRGVPHRFILLKSVNKLQKLIV